MFVDKFRAVLSLICIQITNKAQIIETDGIMLLDMFFVRPSPSARGLFFTGERTLAI